MALSSINFNTHYDQSFSLNHKTILTQHRSNYNDLLNETRNEMSSNIINASIVTILDESNFSGEKSSNETANYFPLPKLLEESWWNIFDPKYLRHGWEWTVTLISVYVLILFAGVIGNCLVILVVLLRPRMRTVTNMFIMNLAVADLLVIIFCVGPTLLTNIFEPWILGMFMCKGVVYMQGVSVCASAYSLVAISLDRCYAVYRPLDRYRGISKSQAMKAISLIWITALSLILPWAVIFNIRISNKNGLAHCNETWTSNYFGNVYFLIANLILSYGLPLVVISISNTVVWCHVSNRNVPHESASSISIVKRVHQRARKNARKMLSLVTFTFLISWLPLYIFVSRLKFATDISEAERSFIEIMWPFAQWLGSSNSCINPIIYAFLNRRFREEFHSLLPSWVKFIQENKMIGMGTGGYGVNVSARYSSNKYRHTRYHSAFCQNSYRQNRIGSAVLISKFRKSSVQMSANLLGMNVNIGCIVNHTIAIANGTTNIIATRGTFGTITDL